MQKGSFRDNIDKLVRLQPRPMMNGKLIAKSNNSWLLVEEYGQADGIVVLHKFTNHEGQIPYDSIREWREPDMVILRAQVNLGKSGSFELSPFLDGSETEMLVEREEFLPARLEFVKDKLKNLTDNEIKILTQLVIQVRMTTSEIQVFCHSIGIPDRTYEHFTQLMYKTQLIEKDDPHRPVFTAWIKDGFAPILERFLLSSQGTNKATTPHLSSSSTPESADS